MKQVLTGLIVILMLSSCTRYVVEHGGSAAGCGVWYEKKFKGNKAPKQRAAKMPVIN